MAVIKNGVDTTEATVVDQGGTDGAVLVTTPGYSATGTVVGAGRAAAPAMLTEDDAGTLTGARSIGTPETSQDHRLRVGADTLLFSDTFNATAQNTNLWAYTLATLTAAQAGAGTVNFSTVQGTTSSHGAFMRTWQHFPLFGTAPTYVEFVGGQVTAPLVANEVVAFGLGVPGSAILLPTDGVNFLLTTAGLIGELRFNNTTTQTGVLRTLAQITVAQMFKFIIVVGQRSVSFWLDDVLLGELDIPSGNGQPFIAGSLPAYMMKYNTGAVSNTNQFRFADVTVSLADLNTTKPWAHQMALAGLNAGVGQNGQTQGSTAGNFANAALTAAGAGSNTALPVGHAAGLGGVATMTAQVTGGAAGDMIVTSYQNPAATINITGRNLVVTGITIDAANIGAAVATTPTTLLFGAAWGHTAASLATAETGSFVTATTHSPRRKPLGIMSAAIATPIGGVYGPPISAKFETPLVVRPGEFFATTVRFLVGTATASQAVVMAVGVDGYWE